MTITEEELKRIAHLARLHLSDEEKTLFRGQLDRILDHFRKLREIPLEDVPPTSHVVDLENVFREDTRENSLGKDSLRKISEHLEEDGFRVPRVV